jgi:sugar phosphate isomerase/epimerase
MAIFNIDYFSTLDRGYYNSQTIEDSKKAGTFAGTDFPEGNPQGTSLTPMEIGTTMAPDTYPVQELQGKIRQGAAKLEIAFSGAGKSGFGGRGSTPEVLGRREREEFRELARLNNVQVSTHATFGKQGLSGLTQQGFSEEEAQKTLKEINKAIEFAATATTGGAVVFHTGEWQRPIMDAGMKQKEIDKLKENDKRKFGEYDQEYRKAPIYLADEKTGQLIALNREQKFYFPEEEVDKKTGMIYVKSNPDGTPKVKEYDYEHAIEYIKNRYREDKEINDKLAKKSDPEILLYGLREQQLREAKGGALRFTEDLETMKRSLEQIRRQKEVEDRVWRDTPESERWKLMEREPLMQGAQGEYIPKKDILARSERELRQKIEGYQSSSVSAQEQYAKIQHEMDRFKPIEEVGIKRTADTLAKAGIKAMEESQKNKRDLKESIYIAPENLFPDFYGSHADEMIKIVEESRKKMAERLKARGISDDEAKKKAQEHIKATLDTGHLNQWRQHFKGDQKEFNKWYLDQVQKMVDKKILGHIHLTDNWGYDDEHLTPGQGNTPIKDTVRMLEKAGFKDFITEVGSFNANTILPDTLAELGSPIYSMGRGISMGRMRHGHFGMTAPGNYIVGGYAPSNDFKLWSEVPLE